MIYVCIVMSIYSSPTVHYCVADMVGFIKTAVKPDIELTVEERNLFSVANNNAIGPRRASWRSVSSIEEKEEQIEDHPNTKLPLIKTYKETVGAQISKGVRNLGRGTGVLKSLFAMKIIFFNLNTQILLYCT